MYFTRFDQITNPFHHSPHMPTLKTVTLGCKVNQYESEYLRQGFARLGYTSAEKGLPADLCIVNTCIVTSIGEAKSRKAIRQIARENPQAEIIVIGCHATNRPEEVAAMRGVVEVITDKRQLPDLLARRGLVDVPSGIDSFGVRHRAYVKVQDGCNMGCSYCIIPTVRPNLISRPAEDVLAEIQRLVDGGYREIVLTGIHLGHYGVDLGSPRTNLATLTGRIADLGGDFRVRISSIEASEASDELIGLMADFPQRVCPHLHISMQSGSDAVLRRMRRKGIDHFTRRCEEVRRRLDRPGLTTDVIVGFPGETDAEFAATCDVVRQLGFSKLHIFRFSPREGTPAATMEDQVPEQLKQRRAAELAELGEQLRRQYFESLIGSRLQVLVERPADTSPGMLLGTSARYAPVELAGPKTQVGQLVTVVAKEVIADAESTRISG